MPRSNSNERLKRYREKRDFGKTPEPSGEASPPSPGEGLRFVIQKHDASHLHYDLRLEMEGVMRSWAVPKGPSLDPTVRRLAMEVEDHPISYNDFEGTIPAGEYGGGTVMLWDVGTYEADEAEPGEDNEAAVLSGYHKGKLSITFHGERLRGSFALVRTETVQGGIRSKWLFLKHKDAEADPTTDITEKAVTSVVSGRTMDEIAAGIGGDRVWHSNRGAQEDTEPRKAVGSKTKVAAEKAVEKKAASASLLPMLASTASEPPTRGEWIYEPKYDGIRVLAFGTPRSVSLVTRNGNDKVRQFPEVAAEVGRLVRKVGKPLVLDGEIVALEDGKIMRFENLQGRMHMTNGKVVEKLAENTPSALIAFDLLLSGNDVLMAKPWTARREALEQILSGNESDQVRLSTINPDYEELNQWTRKEGWEGVIAKRRDARYRPGQRSPDWLKLKINNGQELVVGGWTEPRNSRTFLGALLLGYYDKGELVYAGHTGTGFNRKSLEEMYRRLKKIERKSSPFSTRPPTNQPAHWVSPEVVVEVRFTEWTRDGKLRHPVFLGVRDDKDAKEVVREPSSANGKIKEKAAKSSTRSKAAVAERSEDASRVEPSNGSGGEMAAPKAKEETGRGRKNAATANGEGQASAKGKTDRTTRPKQSKGQVLAEESGISSKSTTRSKGKKADQESDARQNGSEFPEKAAPASKSNAAARKKAAAPQTRTGNNAGENKKSSRSQKAAPRKYPEKELDTPVAARIRELRKSKRDGALKLDSGESLGLSSFEKVFYPSTGHTKGDLLIYYARMGDHILPWMKDRALVLKRFPNGVEGEAFYQQAAPDSVPKGVRVETLHIEGKDQRRLVGGNLATLLYTIQLGAVSFDPWHSRIHALKSADYTILDLDPGPGVDFQGVVQVARWVKEELDSLGLHGALKTSGSSGIHIYLPLPPRTPLEAATLVAQIVATRVARNHPQYATVERMRTNRPHGTVYVDYLQNILGKTVAGVYAARAKKAPTVSTPLAWDELTDELDLQAFTIDTVPGRVMEVGDLWGPAMATPNSLDALKRKG